MKQPFFYLLTVMILSLFTFSSCKQSQDDEIPGLKDLYHHSLGSGDPIMVIHGGPGLGSSYLEEHLAELASTNQVIFYDQRNSGRSPLSTDTSKVRLSGFINDLDSVRSLYGHDKIALLAHSWGGILAMLYALQYPDHVSHLILVNSNTASSELNNQANTKLVNRISADDIEAMTRIRRSEAFLAQNPKAIEELMEIGFSYQFSNRNLIGNLHLNLPEDFGTKSAQLGNLYQDLATYDFTDKLKNITAPTLLLYGLKDPLTPYALNSMPQSFPNVTIQDISEAGHFPFIEQREETIQAIRSFLEK